MRTILSGGRGFALLALLMLALISSEGSLLAWSDHPAITFPVVSGLAEVRDGRTVAVETLDSFLIAEGRKLEQLLSEEEVWARTNLEWPAPLPGQLSFRAGGERKDLVLRFCRAIRVNPRAGFPLYLELVPGAVDKSRSPLTAREISFLTDTSDWDGTAFVRLRPRETVSALRVLLSASDEPDLLGLDIGLFEDNGTGIGKAYGFGPQPFGNPHLEYSSQAPFHMGFYHESRIMYAAAGFLRRTNPERRIHLYRKLAEFSFRTGHPYWGWRFTGWGLHYLLDLTEPYHACVLPGVSTARALLISTGDLLGFHGPRTDAIQLVSNRHAALEQFARIVLQRAYREKGLQDPILAALRSPKETLPYDDSTPRQSIAKFAHDRARHADTVVGENMPGQFVSDPGFELGTSAERSQVLERIAGEKGPRAIDALAVLVKDLLDPFARYGPGYVRAILREAH